MINVNLIIKKYKYKFIIVVFTMCLLSLISLSLPFILKEAMDITEGVLDFNSVKNTLVILSISYIFISIVCACLDYLKNVLLLRCTEEIIKEIRTNTYKKIINLNMNSFSNMHISTLITRMTADINKIGEFIGKILPMFLNSGIFLLTILIIICFINIYFAIIMTTFSILLIIILYKIGEKMKFFNKEDMENLENINNYYSETFSGIKTINLFNVYNERCIEFDKLNDKEFNISKDYYSHQNLLGPTQSIIKYLIISIIIFLCLNNAMNGLDIALIYLVVSYIDNFFEPLTHIIYHYEKLQQGKVSINRIDEILSKEHDFEDIYKGNKTIELDGNIIFQNVDFSYEQDNQVLNNVNFSISKGEKVALIGNTGAGKSTIINLLLGFYKNNSGNILIDNSNIKDISLESLRKNISYIQQNPYIFQDTIRNNITMNNSEVIDDTEVINILKKVQLYEKVFKFKNGLNEIIYENTLSLGEKQLLAFARAIAKKTKIYIFDEPTANVDEQSEDKLTNLMETLLQDYTIIVIAHRPNTIKNVDRILKVENGKVVDYTNKK